MPSWPKDTDLSAELLEALAARKPGSDGRLLTWLLEHFRDVADPDDLDDCLLEVAKDLESGCPPRAPVGFLKKLLWCWNCRGLRAEERTATAYREFASQKSGKSPGAAEELIHEEDLRRVREAVRCLDRLHRAIIEWRMEGVTYEQIARFLSISRDVSWTAAHVRLEALKARRNLRCVLGERDS